MEIFDIGCGKCGSHDFKYVDNKPTCQGCDYVLTDKDTENILHQAYEASFSTKEILVWGDPENEFKRLNLHAKCTWIGKGNSGQDMRVYELPICDFRVLCEDEKTESEDTWQDCCWRSAEGSNMGDVSVRYNINHHYIIAWDGAGREDIIEDNKKEKPDDRYWPERKYRNLLEYFCEEIGAGQPRNVCALAVDLAKQNNISMAKLFEKYQGC